MYYLKFYRQVMHNSDTVFVYIISSGAYFIYTCNILCTYILHLQLILTVIRNQIRSLIVLLQVVTEHHGKVPYLVAFLHPNKDYYPQVITHLFVDVIVATSCIVK